jgi:hypothetical protein
VMGNDCINQWTVQTLKEFVERLFSEHDKRYEQRFNAQQSANEHALESARLAIRKSEESTEKRLELLNELRKEVTQDREFLVQKTTYEPAHRELEKWKEKTEVRLNTIETRSVTWTAALGIFFVILQIVIGAIEFWLKQK